LAALCEQCSDENFISQLLHADDLKGFLNEPQSKLLLNNAIDYVKKMAKQYNKQALEVLDEITNIELKRLLFRITKRILK